MNVFPVRIPLDLQILGDTLAICRLERDGGMPAWAIQGDFFSITRTANELSIVCPETSVPQGIKAERGWKALRVAGVMDLSLVGVLAGLATPLARADVGLFAVSTFDTDYLLVRQQDLGRAVEALTAEGYSVQGDRGYPAL